MPKDQNIRDEDLRPSHRAVIDHIEDWANSPGLRPPSEQGRRQLMDKPNGRRRGRSAHDRDSDR